MRINPTILAPSKVHIDQLQKNNEKKSFQRPKLKAKVYDAPFQLLGEYHTYTSEGKSNKKITISKNFKKSVLQTSTSCHERVPQVPIMGWVF